jgi:formylmethanofuran dehydrogenase subunit C
VSDHVTLSLKAPLGSSVEADGIRPELFGALSGIEIARQPIWLGRRSERLGDVFEIRGERSTRVRVEGVVRELQGLGSGMSSGELVVVGDAGAGVGAGMSGGLVHVLGSVGDDAGVGMSGGTLLVEGSAANRLGAARPGASRGMTGGEIIVRGSAGQETAARCRRGLVVVGGNAGESAGRSMIAGTLLVGGGVGMDPGSGNKRGSLIVLGAIDVPADYRYACTFASPFLRLLFVYLRRQYKMPVPTALFGCPYRRYCGDMRSVGRGEILVPATRPAL